MGMKARLTLSAVVGVAVIGTMSAHAGRVAHEGGHHGGHGGGHGVGKAPSHSVSAEPRPAPERP